jgi:cytochrome b involved in lipid metabolism
MTPKIQWISISLLVLILTAIVIVSETKGKESSYYEGGKAATGPAQTYSLSEVSLHDSADSCYAIVSGNVYDLTPWIHSHPGGADAILSICGKDGTELFSAQHKGQPRPEDMLASFLIGPLER